MIIKLTDFTLRNFDPKFGGTKILDYSPKEFEDEISLYANKIENVISGPNHTIFDKEENPIKIVEGYAPFCKLVSIKNFTDAKVGSLPITLDNYQFIRSGYSKRRDNELPVFSRWLELPLGKPKAEWLVLVLYSKEQIDKENFVESEEEGVHPETFGADWGVVAILAQSHPDEEPMKPETMIRNGGYNTEESQEEMIKNFKILDQKNCSDEAIITILNLQGKLVGGSGIPINKSRYLNSVKFWSNNITIK